MDLILLVYVSSGIVLMISLWLYGEYQHTGFYKQQQVSVIFHCIKCGQLYVEKEKTETAPCPQCRFKNVRLQF